MHRSYHSPKPYLIVCNELTRLTPKFLLYRVSPLSITYPQSVIHCQHPLSQLFPHTATYLISCRPEEAWNLALHYHTQQPLPQSLCPLPPLARVRHIQLPLPLLLPTSHLPRESERRCVSVCPSSYSSLSHLHLTPEEVLC